MFGRMRRGLSIVDDSLDVFRSNPRLAVLPLCSLLVVGGALAVAAAVAIRAGVTVAAFEHDLTLYAAVFVGYGLATGLGAFFNAAVVHCAARHFDGEDASVRDGLAAAWRARRGLLAWAVTSATLGTLLVVVDDKLGPLGNVARFLFDVAWSLLTFFVVPVIVIEDTASVRTMLRKSGDAFTDTWGESVTATLGISAALFPVALVGGVCVGVAYFSLAGAMAWVVGVIGAAVLVCWLVTSQVLGTVARTALYRYATDGERVGPFAERDPGAALDAN